MNPKTTMFQSFEQTRDAGKGKQHAEWLRTELLALQLDGFLVPHADEHMNEQTAERDKRLQWLTGFSGSAGLLIILKDHAALFVDGRYTIQAAAQVDTKIFKIINPSEEQPYPWLSRHLGTDQQIGFDPRLHSVSEIKTFRTICSRLKSNLVPCEKNPLDKIWKQRPPIPVGQVKLHTLSYSGCRAEDKIDLLKKKLKKENVDALITTQPDNIAWLLNIRGTDIPHTPVAMSYLITTRSDKPNLFIDTHKLNQEVHDALAPIVTLYEIEYLAQKLHELSQRSLAILIDPQKTNEWFQMQLHGGKAELLYGSNPVELMKAQKNDVEIAGAKNAHLQDGIAMVRFLAWVDAHAHEENIFEIDLVVKLEAFRAESGKLHDIAFDTIAASGPHAARPHYLVSRESNRRIRKNEILLIDSGAQYYEGTTDVTRTLITGQADDEMRDRFTRTLKGHIAIATIRFPEGISGHQLDPFARRSLWDVGADFDHGTGHGVGSFLSVHEGPAAISGKSHTPLQPGMILSNEPGYYKPGSYGIRIENLILVKGPVSRNAEEQPTLYFETLTLVPIDRNLIKKTLMSTQECQWLDLYHATVRKALEPHLDPDTQAWLRSATAPLE